MLTKLSSVLVVCFSTELITYVFQNYYLSTVTPNDRYVLYIDAYCSPGCSHDSLQEQPPSGTVGCKRLILYFYV